MTTIDGVITNNMDFKHLDTTKNIVITPKDEFGNSVQLNASHTWTAKVSDGTNYVGDYQVTLESNSIVVNSANFTKLPAGQYHLEVWEEWIDSNSKKQRSIYPSPQRTIDFNIYQNVTDLAEKEIKSIGFQDVVDQAVMNVGMNYVFKVNTIEPDQTATVVQSAADGKNYVTFNVPRGAKGDQGNVGPAPTLKIGTVTKLNSDQTPTANISGDNGAYTLDLGIPQGVQGETNATATQALNLANSTNDKLSVIQANGGGRNLVSDSEQEITGKAYFIKRYNLASLTELTPGKTYTVSFSAKIDDKAVNCNQKLSVIIYNSSWSFQSRVYAPISTDYQRVAQTFTIPEGQTGVYNVSIDLDHPVINGKSDSSADKSDDAGTGYIKELMLEEGTVAHDWSPAPEEILTQSDYAKIQAAIVALGGSLK